jgi:hypothetical protein
MKMIRCSEYESEGVLESRHSIVEARHYLGPSAARLVPAFELSAKIDFTGKNAYRQDISVHILGATCFAES